MQIEINLESIIEIYLQYYTQPQLGRAESQRSYAVATCQVQESVHETWNANKNMMICNTFANCPIHSVPANAVLKQ